MAGSESPILAVLKPVVLGNDDFDDETALLKEVAQSEFSRNQNVDVVNVSNVHSVQVTEENVNELFNSIDGPNSQLLSTFQCGQPVIPHPGSQTEDTQDIGAVASDPLNVDNLLSLVRLFPKDLFITQVLQLSSSDRDMLERVRMVVLECIQQSDGYPFSLSASLKKRLQTRTGDSVEYKLAQDVYCLSSVLDGADWDDLRDVLNIPPPKKSISQSACDVSFQAMNITEFEQLKTVVQGLTADMVAIKQENIAIKTELNSEIKSLRSDLNQLQADITGDISEVRSLISTNAQSIERVCNDRSNGVANLKSDIKLLHSEVKSILDDPVFSISVSSIGESINKMSAFDSRLNKLEKRVQSGKTTALTGSGETSKPGQCKQSSNTVTEDQGKVETNTQSQDAAEKQTDASKQQYIAVHVNKADANILVKTLDTNTFSRVPLDNIPDLRAIPAKGLWSNVITSNSKQPTSHQPSRISEQQPNRESVFRKTGANGSDKGESTPKGQTDSSERNVTDRQDGHPNSDMQFQNKIPVRINASRNLRETDTSREKRVSQGDSFDNILSDDIEFSTFVRKRTKRFYVGGFKSSITQEKLITYVESKGLTVTWVKIWISNKSGRVIIRLNVEASGGYYRISEPGFWPKGAMCRPWVSKNLYTNSRKSRGGEGHYNSNYNGNNDYNNGRYGNEYDGYGEYDQYNEDSQHY